jgi:putative hydrolase of the HAD superfamily
MPSTQQESSTPESAAQSTAQSAAQSAPQIEAVLFDYGQVLSNPPDPAAWARIRAITGLEEQPLHEAYWAFRHDYDRAALAGAAYWHAVAERTGITLDDAQLNALFAADVDLWTTLNLPMVEWAGRLQSAGIRTGILSNIGDAIAAGIIKKFPWLAGFDHCTWSHALFMAKPEPAIFLKTAEALNTAPQNILFLDDREDNIAAADALGFQTIQYTTHPAFEREMRSRGLAALLDIGLPPQATAGHPAPVPAHTAK